MIGAALTQSALYLLMETTSSLYLAYVAFIVSAGLMEFLITASTAMVATG